MLFMVLQTSKFLKSLVEVLRIDVLSGGDIVEKAFEMAFHRLPRTLRIVRLDCGQDGFVLADHLYDSPVLGQRQQPIAVDVDFHLLDELPDSRIPGNVGDCGMKHFVGLMKGVAVSGGTCLTLALQYRAQG